jgi:hypothetical protein
MSESDALKRKTLANGERRVLEGDALAMEAAVCFLELRPRSFGESARRAMHMQLRVARPVSDLERSAAMYRYGLGFTQRGHAA